MKPFTMDHRNGADSVVDVSFLLDAPAGRDGFVIAQGGHLAKPNGERLRLWGVNVTDWSKGSVMLPAKEDAPVYAATLARFGINCVRLHFLDLLAPRGLIDSTRDDTQHFDADQLDRLDFWVAELKRRGIYCDLNLMVGRTYKAGDALPEYDRIGWAKGVSYFDPRLIELQKAYAELLLTHYNPYTQSEYRHEPAIVIVELVNENSLIDAWYNDRLHPQEDATRDPNFRLLTAYHDDMLTRMYNDYLAQALSPEELTTYRALAGVSGDAPVQRLRKSAFVTAHKERFQTEAAFYMHVERAYFNEMQAYLKGTLGVQSLLIGTSDYLHDQSNYPLIWSNAALDIIDGHVYWQHPNSTEERNTPMVNDPAYSTVTRLSRTALAGKPYIVSEMNHAFPNDWVSEAIPIIAAYACLQDWDGIIWYTFEPKRDSDWEPYIGDSFDISLDPVRMPQLAAAALMFLRGDVSAACTTIERTYSLEQVRETLRLSSDEKPYYTSGFPLSLPLQHKMRIGSLEGPPNKPISAPVSNPIQSDTGELAWYTSTEKTGLVTIDAPRSQAMIGFVTVNGQSTHHLAAEVSNTFCAITLTTLGSEPIARSDRLLLTVGARVENSDTEWDETRTVVTNRGGPPSLIEPVSGRIMLRNLEPATAVRARVLDGAGRPLGDAVTLHETSAGWEITVGEPVTTWYEIQVER